MQRSAFAAQLQQSMLLHVFFLRYYAATEMPRARGASRTLENRLDNPSTNSRSHLSVPNADRRRDDDILQDDRMPAACRSGPAELWRRCSNMSACSSWPLQLRVELRTLLQCDTAKICAQMFKVKHERARARSIC